MCVKKCFYVNDNIFDFLEFGEIDQFLDEVEEKFKDVFRSFVIDIENDYNMSDIVWCVVKMYVNEVFKG